jgi:hypothetical protein
MSSPDYLKQKTYKFFNQLGKPEFIILPKPKNKLQKEICKHLRISYESDFWTKYCTIWHTKNDDYEIMNIINFLLNVIPPYGKNFKKSPTFDCFEKYIGDMELISKDNLSHMAHAKIIEHLDQNLNLENDRYCKLRVLKSME